MTSQLNPTGFFPDQFFHEQRYRSAALMAKLQPFPITLCGAGALGANLAETLARSGCGRLKVIDRDRVEERNLSTQPYSRAEIGALKAKTLANGLYRALGLAVEAQTKELTPANAAALLRGSALVVDTFDNSAARQAVRDACGARGLPCLHVGLASDYAEVIWDEVYRVPSAAQDDVCDYALARSLVLLTVAVACETVIGFIAEGQRRNFSITLRDLAVRPLVL